MENGGTVGVWLGVMGCQFWKWGLASTQPRMKACQCGRLGLVTLHTAARASNKGLLQDGFSAFNQAQEPLQIHGLLLHPLSLDVLR